MPESDTNSSPEQAAESAAAALVALMWHANGATWFEVDRWFTRMWSAGNPADEAQVRTNLEAGVASFRDIGNRRPSDPIPVHPQELIAHWSQLVAAALREEKFSAQALASFLEEFQVPVGICAELMRVELAVMEHERHVDELQNRNSAMLGELRVAGLEAGRQDRSEVGDRMRASREEDRADRARESEASRALGKARSDFRAAEHRAEVYGKQHAAGRRTDAQLEEARAQKDAAEEHLRQAQADVDRIRAENTERREQRRNTPTAMDAHRQRHREVFAASAELEQQIADSKAQKTELQQRSAELRRAYQRQNDFYDAKRAALRDSEDSRRHEEWLRRRQKEEQERAERAEELRIRALRAPGGPVPATPPSPEAQRWVQSLRSMHGIDVPAAPSPPPPGAEPPAQPPPGGLSGAEAGAHDSPPSHPGGPGPAPHGTPDGPAPAGAVDAGRAVHRAVDSYRALPAGSPAAEFAAAAAELRNARAMVAGSESAALQAQAVAGAALHDALHSAPVEVMERLLRAIGGGTTAQRAMDDIERLRADQQIHGFADVMERLRGKMEDTTRSLDEIAEAAERVAQTAVTVEQAGRALDDARALGDGEATAEAAERLRRARVAFVAARVAAESAMTRLDQDESDTALLMERIAEDSAAAMPGTYDPDEALRRLVQPPEEGDGPAAP